MTNDNFPISNFLDTTALHALKPKNDNFEFTKSNTTKSNTFSDSEISEINSEILLSLSKNIPSQKFDAFFSNSLILQRIELNNVFFCTTSNFNKKMITDYYFDLLTNSVAETLGPNYKIHLTVIDKELDLSNFLDSKLPEDYVVNKAATVKKMSFSINELRPAGIDVIDSINSKALETSKSVKTFHHVIDRKKTFHSFIVGPSNNLAHASATAVSNDPGQAYSALYVYGGSGLGKTHLLHAIANKILESRPSLKIDITSATDFMSDMMAAYSNNDIVSFRKRYYEDVDVLMVDDIHMLKDKKGTQEEFFNVFNELQRRKKQLVFTSDKEPREITGLEDRIKTRLSSSLVVDISSPDYETRVSILKQKAIEENIFIPDDVIELIATSIKSNIRELEGSLIKLGAYSSVFNVDIDIETAKEQLKINPDDHQKTVNIDTISKTVSKFFNVPVADLRSKGRQQDITKARHIAMYFCYYIGRFTLVQIGDFFGKRDHTSVMHGVNKVKGLIKSDSEYSKVIYEIESLI